MSWLSSLTHIHIGSGAKPFNPTPPPAIANDPVKLASFNNVVSRANATIQNGNKWSHIAMAAAPIALGGAYALGLGGFGAAGAGGAEAAGGGSGLVDIGGISLPAPAAAALPASGSPAAGGASLLDTLGKAQTLGGGGSSSSDQNSQNGQSPMFAMNDAQRAFQQQWLSQFGRQQNLGFGPISK
jgi:hypothetical protein